jgi:hypothetical protein
MDFEEIMVGWGEFYYILVLVKIVQQWALSMKICMYFHAQL